MSPLGFKYIMKTIKRELLEFLKDQRSSGDVKECV